MAKGKSIGVIAIKGGVGKTTTVVSLGAILANDYKQKVLLIDANLSAPNLGMHLGIGKPKGTLKDVLLDKISIKDALFKHELGFDVLPSVFTSNAERFSVYKLKEKLDAIRSKYDYVLIDSSPNLNNEMLLSMAASDELVVVTTPDNPTLMCTIEAVEAAKKQNTPIKGLIINKRRGKSFEVSQETIENLAKVPILGVLPDDINILKALSEGTPVSNYSRRAKISNLYRGIAENVMGSDFQKPLTISRRFKNFFGQFVSVEAEDSAEPKPVAADKPILP
ncbi:MAG: AAA family ATPase [Candidatus Woesearchaeota archaeon]